MALLYVLHIYIFDSNGDSGGPLMRYYERGNVPHYFLAGIVSYGPKNCGTKDVPGVGLMFEFIHSENSNTQVKLL